MTRRDTAVVGLTGGIASGKSTVAGRWRERGARIIDADQLARRIVEPGQPALAEIVRVWGPGMLTPEGTLDRGKLGALVFSDREALARLNAITHPAIMALVGAALLQARRDRLPWVVYEAALILENNLAPGLSALVVIIADPAQQLRRLMMRSGLDEQAAAARIAAQTDNATRRSAADYALDNTGSMAELIDRADELFDALVERFGVIPPTSPSGAAG